MDIRYGPKITIKKVKTATEHTRFDRNLTFSPKDGELTRTGIDTRKFYTEFFTESIEMEIFLKLNIAFMACAINILFIEFSHAHLAYPLAHKNSTRLYRRGWVLAHSVRTSNSYRIGYVHLPLFDCVSCYSMINYYMY